MAEGPTNRLYVGNIPWSTTVDELRGIFSGCGTITLVDIPTGRQGRSRGYGIVEYSNVNEAQVAIQPSTVRELFRAPAFSRVGEDRVGARAEARRPSPPPSFRVFPFRDPGGCPAIARAKRARASGRGVETSLKTSNTTLIHRF